MWTKDDYQEQMLGYLDEVQADLEQIARSHFRSHNLRELYIDFDMTFERLWRLIEASDDDWEDFRFPLEISCDRLQQAFYRLARPEALKVSASLRIAEHQRQVELWETAGVL